MKLSLILLICSLAIVAAFSRGGGGGSRSHVSRPSFRAPARAQIRAPSRPVMRSPPKPQVRAPVRPVIRAPPKPQIRAPIRPVIKAPPKINPLPKVVPKTQIKPIVKAPIAKPLIKAPIKPAAVPPKPIVKAPIKPVASPPKPIVKAPVKPAVAPPKPVVKAPVKLSVAPPKSVIKTPVKPAVVPPKPVVKAPVKPAVAPPKPVVKAPVKPAVAPPKPVVKAPVKPAVVPPKPVVKAPVKPAVAPPKPVVKAPVKPVPIAKAPAKPVVSPPKPAAKTPAKTPLSVSPPKFDPKVSGTIKVEHQIAGTTKTGSQVTIDAKKNIWESKNKQHSVDATLGATKQLGGPQGNTKPDVTLGGQYSYNTDKTQITASASGKPHQGLDLNAAANQNIWQSKNQKHSIDATADVSKHLGGPQGNTKTDVTLGGKYSYNGDKTQITASANGKPGQGVDLKLGAEQKLWESQNKRHSIGANAEVSKHLGGPQGNEKTQVGLGAQYTYEAPKTQITASVNGAPGQGAQIGLDARQNIWQNDKGNTKLDVTGGVSKQIGGPNGNGKPEGHVGIELSHDF